MDRAWFRCPRRFGFSELIEEVLVRTGVDPGRIGFVLPDSTSSGTSALIRVLRERGCEFRAPQWRRYARLGDMEALEMASDIQCLTH